MATFLIFAYSSESALQDALSTTGSYFGAVATLGAAVIAAYLFNDWRDQHNKNVEAGICINIFDFAYISNFKLLQNLTIIENNIINIHHDRDAIKELSQVLENLQAIRDEIITILVPKTHLIVSEEDYEKIFFPIFNQITLKTELYIVTIKRCIDKQVYKNDPSYGALIKDLQNGVQELIELINIIPTKLKPYYKALT